MPDFQHRRKKGMPLRSADSYAYAKFRSTLADSDCNAILSDGTVLPVLIEDQGTKLYVEIDYRFYNPETLPNFVRYELTAAERAKEEAEAAKAAEPEKPKNFAELQQKAEQTARNTMVQRYQDNREQQAEQSNVNRTVQMFADAAKREREAAAARMRPSR
jgi:hypothetical protein